MIEVVTAIIARQTVTLPPKLQD